jgi:hypothetical protein
MEKQGMGKRRHCFRAGLLVRILFFIPVVFPSALWSQSGENQAGSVPAIPLPPAGGNEGAAALYGSGVPGDGVENEGFLFMQVLAVISPVNPVVRGNLVVTVLADHFPASEVTVKPPSFPSTVILERVRTESRNITQPGRLDESGPAPEPRRWTAVEFLFTPLVSGNLSFESFEAAAAGKRGITGPVSVRVSPEPLDSQRKVPVLRWEKPPASLAAGEAGEIILALSNWDLKKPEPRYFLRGKTPENVIMEEMPEEGAGADGVIRYRFRIIPLEGQLFTFPPFSFHAGGVQLEVPGLKIPVTAPNPAVRTRETGAAPDTPAPGESLSGESVLPEEPSGPNPAFPEIEPGVFPLFRNEYRRVIGEVRSLWEEGSRARALAEIRRAERDSLAGPAFIPLRRAMEESLRLTFTEDEQWRPWRTPVFSWVIVVFLITAAVVSLKIRVTLFKFKGYRNVIFVVVTGVAVFFLFSGGLGDRLKSESRGTPAVLEKTGAYRVPDSGGTVNTGFEEGRPVNIRSFRGAWIYAESTDGKAGWVPAGAVIPY